ncbi:hypothetical protein LZ30DRAFT_697537 [Colletotrichum cereale]|nr:hypothetical protein LZ30DRAFT_697537 [Colletotrichum cereale]
MPECEATISAYQPMRMMLGYIQLDGKSKPRGGESVSARDSRQLPSENRPIVPG